MNIRRYSELKTLRTFEDRFNYIKLDGAVGVDTFGYDRYLNQNFYKSDEWKKIRDYVIIRDNGCDLGLDGFQIYGKVLIHHMNPIDSNDIIKHTELLLDPEYLISVSLKTHNGIHYGDMPLVAFTERKPNDTCPWKN